MNIKNSAHIVRHQNLIRLVNVVGRLTGFSRSVVETQHGADAGHRHPTSGRIEVAVIDDPDGNGRLIGVRGTITAANAQLLLRAVDGLVHGHGLHVDLTDATIPTIGGLRQLESVFDELERRSIHLRVVGVDPLLPALVAVG